MIKWSDLLYYHGVTRTLALSGRTAGVKDEASPPGRQHMTDQLQERRHRDRRFGRTRPSAPVAPTGWALNREGPTSTGVEPECTCGSVMTACLGCGQVRCLTCDPYLSDDCRWKL